MIGADFYKFDVRHVTQPTVWDGNHLKAFNNHLTDDSVNLILTVQTVANHCTD